MFKNCNLLESFSKIIPDDDIPKMNNIENDINYDFYSQNKINIIGNNNSFDYWGAGSESSKYSTIPEHSLKDEENLYNSKKENINLNNELKYESNDLPNNSVLLKEMFFNCESLLSLHDISNINTKEARDMSYMFYNCESLKSLPDISKWNTSKVIYLNHIFDNCKSLKSLPDISK